jgi:hypothetical protein
MMASANGNQDTVLTLLECRADLNAKSNVRNQMMMIMMMLLMIVINYVDRDVCR